MLLFFYVIYYILFSCLFGINAFSFVVILCFLSWFYLLYTILYYIFKRLLCYSLLFYQYICFVQGVCFSFLLLSRFGVPVVECFLFLYEVLVLLLCLCVLL